MPVHIVNLIPLEEIKRTRPRFIQHLFRVGLQYYFKKKYEEAADSESDYSSSENEVDLEEKEKMSQRMNNTTNINKTIQEKVNEIEPLKPQ